MAWQPELASRPIEEIMESMDAPEGDRDEVRRMSEFLAAKKAKQPLPKAMKDWLRGDDLKGAE